PPPPRRCVSRFPSPFRGGFVMLALLLLLAVPASARDCPPVSLAISGSKQFAKAYAPVSPAMRKTSANFAQAYTRACAEGLLKAKPLTPSGRLVLVNAPDANMGSIYST